MKRGNKHTRYVFAPIPFEANTLNYTDRSVIGHFSNISHNALNRARIMNNLIYLNVIARYQSRILRRYPWLGGPVAEGTEAKELKQDETADQNAEALGTVPCIIDARRKKQGGSPLLGSSRLTAHKSLSEKIR